MIKNKKLFTRKKPLTIALCGVGLFVMSTLLSIAVLHYVSPHHAAVPSRVTVAAAQPDMTACKLTDGLRVCLSSPKGHVSSSEDVILRTTLINTTRNDITEVFSCTFTDPGIVLNDKDLSIGSVCDETITTKTVKAGQTSTYDFKLSGSLLKTGDNTLLSRWHKYDSGEITLTKEDPTATELAKQFTACQSVPDNPDHADIPTYCATMGVLLKDSTDIDKYTCTDWKVLFKRVGLSVPCVITMDNKAGFIYVPREDATRWLDKVKAMPEVESAFVDRQYPNPLPSDTPR